MVSLYGHVIYALSTAIASDNPAVQQSIMQELPLCASTFSDWLYASVGIPTINGNGIKDKILSAKRKVTRMLMTIVAAFAVCWLPSHLWWLLVRASDLAVGFILDGIQNFLFVNWD
ncbi:unnamed protein product [Nippostrongylus brasiliensis]|uniref:G_PROTEIN_RECEP_F1_2 domain-containing protein n=1 Tax=Nippostrongylus brasiliensis TaxID=27835 RepID=A0A0N4Y651_NIPBR|nr:unnamed protein product [Nippostrongylus brasiliensis]